MERNVRMSLTFTSQVSKPHPFIPIFQDISPQMYLNLKEKALTGIFFKAEYLSCFQRKILLQCNRHRLTIKKRSLTLNNMYGFEILKIHIHLLGCFLSLTSFMKFLNFTTISILYVHR